MNTAIAMAENLHWFRLFVFPTSEDSKAFHVCVDPLSQDGYLTEARADALALVFGGARASKEAEDAEREDVRAQEAAFCAADDAKVEAAKDANFRRYCNTSE